MNFLSELGLKGLAILALIAVCLIGYTSYNNNKEKVVDLKVQVKNQAVTIATQKATIETGKKITVVKETVQVETQKAIKETTIKHEGIARRAETATREITRRYDAQPVTLITVDQRQTELSTVHIDSLWESYCAVKPDDPLCQTLNKPQGEPNA